MAKVLRCSDVGFECDGASVLPEILENKISSGFINAF